MKILCLMKHNSGDNDDEGAVTHAFEQLGHEVIRIHEDFRFRQPGEDPRKINADFCLIFKSERYGEILDLKCQLVTWYFDLISSTEDSLLARMHHRREWYRRIEEKLLVGFFTDGDWCQQHPDKCYWLMQGADERVTGPGNVSLGLPPILFTGMIHHGQKRVNHVRHLQQRYGERFEVLGDAGPKYRIHGRHLADRLCSARVVIAPDGPTSDYYWSNRVFLSLGFGSFLLHPHCDGLSKFYGIGTELQTFSSREELDDLIDYYLKDENERERRRLMKAGYERTLKSNLYRHRCEELIRVVKERL